MFKKSAVVTLIFIISTLIQLISNIFITRFFGARVDLDIFLAAVALPTIIVTVIYGTLNDTFLPIYTEKKIKDKNSANEYFNSILFYLTIIGFLSAIILGIFSTQISQLLYGSRGEEFIKNVSLQFRFMLYSIPFSIIATLFGAIFYADKKFVRFPLAQAIGSVINLLFIIIFANSLGIWSLVFAFVINIIFQIFFILPKKLFKLTIPFRNLKSFTALFFSWIPLIIANFALRSDTLLMRSFGVNLPNGYLVYLNLISKIFSLAAGVITIGLQIVLLPHLVEYFVNKKYEAAILTINKAKIFSIILSISVVASIIIFSPFFIYLLFVGGKFSAQDAQTVISLLPVFILPGIGWGINGVFFQPLIALRKYSAVAVINIVSLSASWAVASLVNNFSGPLEAIKVGLICLLFFIIIGSELTWQYYKRKLYAN